MDADLLKIAIAVAVLLAGFAMMVVLLHGKGRKRFDRLSPAFELGTSKPTGFLGSAVGGLYRGYSCRYQIQYASQYDRGGAILQVSVTSPHQWSAELEKPGSRLLARFGLVQDLECGDADLDQHFRFAARDEGIVKPLFGNESVLAAMHLLAAGENFDNIHVRADRVDVKWSPREPQLDEDSEVLRGRLEYVTAFVVACGYPPSLPPTQ
jgi:hypothetical protein